MVIPSNGQPPTAAATHFNNEREILYSLFFDMKKDVTELKKMFLRDRPEIQPWLQTPTFAISTT